MKKTVLMAGLVFAIALSACNNRNNPGLQALENDSTSTQKAEPMKNLISIVEIPVVNFQGAVKFYQNVLGVTIREVEMDGVTLGVIPNAEGTVNVVLAKGTDYKPTTDGAVLYLNSGKDLQPMLDKVKQNGGRILLQKTEISAEMGFFALFIDTEGNKMGLHSTH